MARIYKPKDSPYYYVDARREEDGRFSTGKRGAEAFLLAYERGEAHPPSRQAEDQAARLEDALRSFLEEGGHDLAPATLGLYAEKAGHLLRLMGDRRLRDLQLADVEAYIETRLQEGAARSTVRKDLNALARALDHAIARGMPAPHKREVIPRFTGTSIRPSL